MNLVLGVPMTLRTDVYLKSLAVLLCSGLCLLGCAESDEAGTPAPDVSASKDAEAGRSSGSEADAGALRPEGGPEDALTPDDAPNSGDAEEPELQDSAQGGSDAQGSSGGADGEEVGDTTVEVEALDVEADDASAPVFTLSSPAFEDGGEMPEEFVCCLGNPQLNWGGAPEGTVSFALIFDDPDAGDYDHWALYNIPGEVSGLDAGISAKGLTPTLPEGASELINGFSFSGYLGPCPPAKHTYRWRLWALSEAIDEAPASFSELEAQASALSLGEAVLTNTFGPKSPAQGATCE